MATFYAAYEIDPTARQLLIDTFMPKYPDVVAHHVTYKYDAVPDDVPAPPQKAQVVGYHDSGALQVLVVDIDGNRHQAPRADGVQKLLHITFSLDRAQGVSPSKSNAFLEKIVAEKGSAALYNLPDPIEITVTPKLILDPPKPQEAAAAAKEILAQKSDGPNGLLAYSIVNDLRVRADGTTEPFFNPQSPLPLELAYAFFETDRVGVPVISAPGGTQDVHVSHKATGQRLTIELTKEKSLRAALHLTGIAQPAQMSVADLEQHTVAALIMQGFDVEIESALQAALREAKEEQGIDLINGDIACGNPVHFSRQAITKRSLDNMAESTHADLLSLRDIQSLDGVATRIADMRAMGTDAPPENTQNLFAVQVDSFAGTKLNSSGPKVENKIPGRQGSIFSEKGVFATLTEMEKMLELALPRAQTEERLGNTKAAQEIFATYERLQLFRGIEAHLIQELRHQGVNVETAVPLDRAIDPVQPDAADLRNAQIPQPPKSKRRHFGT